MATESSFGGLVAGTTMDSSVLDVGKLKSKKQIVQQNSTKKKTAANESKASEAFGAKMMIKHGFGSTALMVDGIQSYSTLLGEKETNDRMIYRIGRQLCVFDPEHDKQQFFTGRPKGVVNVLHFAISQNSRYVCICETIRNEKSDQGHSQASIYSLTTFARQKTLIQPSAVEFIGCCFCGDSKYVMTLSDEPDRLLALWQWEKERLVKTVILTSRATKISAAPSFVQVMVSGPGYLKSWFQGVDGGLRMASLLPAAKENENFIDHAWLPTAETKRMVALTDSDAVEGQSYRQNVFIFETAEGSSTTNHSSSTAAALIALELRQTLTIRLDPVRLRRVIPFGRGFILGGSGGHLSFYERTDDKKDPFQEFRSLTLGKEGVVGGTVPPSEDRIVVLTEGHSLLSLSLQNIDPLNPNDDKVTTSPTGGDLIFGGFHKQPVIGVDMAQERPSLVTIAQDHTARMWNFDALKCDLVHDFKGDEPSAVAMFYTGFEVLVAFKERVRLYNVLLDKLKPYKETSVKGCKDLKFSHCGNMWAAASTVSVMVYDTRTFHQLASFQGHLIAVRRVAWSPGDQVLFSAGAEGNVYGWPVRPADPNQKMDRLDVISSSSGGSRAVIVGLAVDGDPVPLAIPGASTIEKGRTGVSWQEDGENEAAIMGNSVVISVQDGTMKVAEWDAAPRPTTALTAARETPTQSISAGPDGSVFITELQISSDRQLVYAGTNNGAIRIYPWPLQDGNSFSETLVHSCPVVGLRESPAGNAVISVGSDGSVFVNVVFRGEQAVYASTVDALDSYGADSEKVFNSDVILVSSCDIDDHVKEVVDLQKRLEDATTKHTFELHQRESTHNDDLRRLVEQHESIVNFERDKYEALQMDFDRRLRELHAAMETKTVDHHKVTSELENRYEHKLATQLERYDRLSEEMELLKQSCDGLLAAERQQYEAQLKEVHAEARAKEKRFKAEIKHHKEDRVADENSFKEVLDQQENEYEDELRQLIAAAETELKNERETITKLRTLAQTKSTKIGQLKTKVKELESLAKNSQRQLAEEKREKQKLVDTIEHCKKNLFEREEALSEKEKVILELRNSTRTLENFRFVLDHRLQQLMAERGPITKHIEGLEHHIRTMYEELVEEFDGKKDQQMQDELKDLKLQSYVQEVDRLRHQHRQKELYIASFKRELSNAVGAPGGPKEVEAAVKMLYRKYVRGEVGGSVVRGSGAATLGESHGESLRGRALLDADDTLDGGTRRKTSPQPSTAGGIAKKADDSSDGLPTRDVDNDLLEAAKEAERQKSFAERSAHNLKHRLQSTKAEAIRVNHSRLLENSQLVFECNELRREMKLIARELDATKQREAEMSRQLHSLRSHSREKTSASRPKKGSRESSCLLPGEGSDSLLAPSFIGAHSATPQDVSSSSHTSLSIRLTQPLVGSEMAPDHNPDATGGTLSQAHEWRGVTSLVSSVPAPTSTLRGSGTGATRDRKNTAEEGVVGPSAELSRSLPLTTPVSGSKLSNRLKLTAATTGSGLESTVRKSQGSSTAAAALSPVAGSNTGHLRVRGREEFLANRLGREVEQLTAQLDETTRESAMQQAEIARLRQELLKRSSAAQGQSRTGMQRAGAATKSSSSKAVKSSNSLLQLSDSDDMNVPSKGPVYYLDPDYDNGYASMPSTASSVGPSREDLELMKLG